MHDLEVALPAFERLARNAVVGVGEALSGLFGRPLRLAPPHVDLVPLGEAVAAFGGEEAEAVAVLLGFSGDLSGHILLLLSQPGAAQLVRWCLPEPASAEVEESVLTEAGNVAGSAFVNHTADSLGLRLQVSPPQLAIDMMGAVLGSVLPLAEARPGHVLLVRTALLDLGSDILSQFVLAPDGPSLDRLARLLEGEEGSRGR